MIERIFLIVFPIFAVAAAGYLYARWRPADMSVANRLNMDIFVPALIFDALSARTVDLPTYAVLAVAATVVVLGSGVLAWPLARWLRYDTRTFVPPMMFTNAGNMGLPLVVLTFGPEALPAAVIVFVIESGLHFTLGVYFMDHRAGLLHVLRMPLIPATLAGLACSGFGVQMPEFLATPIAMLGQVCIPLMLFSLGVRITEVDFSDWRIGLVGALACPASGLIAAALVLLVIDLPPLQEGVLVLFAALPPAVLNYMVAEQYRQEPARVASIVMMGNLATVAVLPAVLAFVLRG